MMIKPEQIPDEVVEAAAIAMVDSYNAGRYSWQQLDLHRSTKCIEVEVK